MEELAVVYFVMEKEGRGKKKRKSPWQYRTEKTTVFCEDKAVLFITVYLPVFYYGKKKWTSEAWDAYMQELPVLQQGEKVYYLYEEEAEAFLHRKPEPLPLSWLLFLIGYYRLTFDSLILLADRDMDIETLTAGYVQKARYIGVATADSGMLEAYREVLSDEYGFILDVAEDYKSLHVPKKGQVLVIAGENLYGATPAVLPANCVWLSTAAGGISGRRLCARTEGARFLDITCFFKANLLLQNL